MSSLRIRIYCPGKLRIAVIISHLVLICEFSNGQTGDFYKNQIQHNIYYQSTDSGIIIINSYRQNCKAFLELSEGFIPYETSEKNQRTPVVNTLPAQPKFLTVHGNLSYDYFYRSRIDTPIQQKNFQQHTEGVYLDILVKEKYPLKVNFTSRQSNSPYFRNFVDVNFNFDRFSYNRNLKHSY